VLPFDDNLCLREPCLNFETCLTVLKFGNASDFIASDSVLFRPIHPKSTFACVCPAGFTGMCLLLVAGSAICNFERFLCLFCWLGLFGNQDINSCILYLVYFLKVNDWLDLIVQSFLISDDYVLGSREHYLCDTEVDLCYSAPCQNGGTCMRKEGSYSCVCKHGFVGRFFSAMISKINDTYSKNYFIIGYLSF